jgi:hypothetical protein
MVKTGTRRPRPTRPWPPGSRSSSAPCRDRSAVQNYSHMA